MSRSPLLFTMMIATAATFMGPPHLRVTAVTSAPRSGAPALAIEVEHHSRPDQLSVTGRAEGQRRGQRVTVPLDLRRVDSRHFTVTRTWDQEMPWVLVIAAEQGPNGSHGVAEAVVSIRKDGTVNGIEYVTPGYVASTGVPLRTSKTQVDALLQRLQQMP